MDDAHPQGSVTTESREISLVEAGNALSVDNFRDDTGPAESSPPPAEEKEAELPALTDDTKVTLKDGTEVSIRELKRGYVSRKTFTAKSQALADERARFEELHATTQQHSRLVADMRQCLDRAAAYLLPRQPDPNLVDTAPQQWKAQQAHYEHAMGLLAQVQRAARMEFDAAQAARNAQERDFRHRQAMVVRERQNLLIEAMPELAKTEEARKFWSEATAMAEAYGYDESELSAICMDHRSFPAVRDLIRYRNAVKAAPKVKERVSGVRVMQGSKRMDVSATSARSARTEFEQFRQSGRRDDAAALLAKRIG